MADSIGVKTENLLLSQPDSGEQALSLVDTLIRSGSVDVMVVDSGYVVKFNNHDEIFVRRKQQVGKHGNLRILRFGGLKEEEEFMKIVETFRDILEVLEADAYENARQGAPLLFPALGNKLVAGDKHRNKEKELQVLESTLKDLKNLVSSRLVEIKSLHDRRIEILRKLADMQNSLVNVQSISPSKGYLLLSEQMDKSEADMDQCRTSLEKLQVVEKDNFTWYEKEVTVKADIADLSRRFSAFSESQIAKLEKDFQKLAEEKLQLESKHEHSSREPGRKEIISEFKALVSSLPKNMAIMQSEVSRYKAATTEIHSVRAEVQSLSTILDRKVSQLEALSGRSTNQLSEIKKLQAVFFLLIDADSAIVGERMTEKF